MSRGVRLEFTEPARPISADPRHDLGMSSFGVVKVTGGGWEPKVAFRTPGELYRPS
jgi:hypothetical protein